MMPLIVLGALVAVPVVLILLLRVNAAIAFMSLALGSLLVTYAAGDITAMIGGFSSGRGSANNQWVQLGLLVAPFLLTLLFTRKNVKGSKQFINALPAVASGLLLALLVVPLLPKALSVTITHQSIWQQLSNMQTAVVLGGAAFCLLVLLVTHRKKHDPEADKHSKH